MNTLKAEKRSMNVKAKKLRKEGYIIGNLFGHKIEGSIPLQMPKKETEALLRKEGKGGQILLELEGTQYDVLIKNIDYDPTKKEFSEIDLQALVSDEKVQSVAKIVFENRDVVKEGVIDELLEEVAYKAYPSALIEKITVDLSTLHIGDCIHVKDLDLAHNPDIDLITNPETAIVEVIAARNSVPVEETAEEGA